MIKKLCFPLVTTDIQSVFLCDYRMTRGSSFFIKRNYFSSQYFVQPQLYLRYRRVWQTVDSIYGIVLVSVEITEHKNTTVSLIWLYFCADGVFGVLFAKHWTPYMVEYNCVSKSHSKKKKKTDSFDLRYFLQTSYLALYLPNIGLSIYGRAQQLLRVEITQQKTQGFSCSELILLWPSICQV